MNAAPRIRVTIDRLVLRGFDPSDGRAFAAALETELLGRLTDSTLATNPGRSRRLARLNLGRIEPLATARQVGTNVARRLARSIVP